MAVSDKFRHGRATADKPDQNETPRSAVAPEAEPEAKAKAKQESKGDASPGPAKKKPKKQGGATPGAPANPPGRPPSKSSANPSVRAPARGAHRRPRHRLIALSFIIVVLLPAWVTTFYLHARAQDQYASTLGFVVRQEEVNSAMELLGGLSQFSGSSSSDTDILYEFIQSQQLVSQIDARLDLRTFYSRYADVDPFFALDPESSIEDLVSYWSRMVRLHYDIGSGLIELQVRAFDPREAQIIAQAIFDDSAAMINELSAIARDDATRYTREEMEQSVERLKDAREAMAQFRSETRIVDPQADVQGQMGLINNLQQQLASALIEADLLAEITGEGDPRIQQASRRIAVIRDRIAEERGKFVLGGDAGSADDYVRVLSEFERLTVDREFAEQAYLAALSAHDSALAEAQRKSRYLAAYITPTLPEEALYPQRLIIASVCTAFLLMIWAIGVLVFYSIKDRR
ncbi:MAG: sugar transporter [Pseudomonadota bacterium]